MCSELDRFPAPSNLRSLFAGRNWRLGDENSCDRLPRLLAAAACRSSFSFLNTSNWTVYGTIMPRRRYTVLIADRSTGVLRRVTISLRTAVAVVTTVLMMPVLIGLGAKWSARDEIGQLQATTAALQVENGNFRQTTGELTTQIQSLENVIDDLGARAIDPAQARAIQKLPAI